VSSCQLTTLLLQEATRGALEKYSFTHITSLLGQAPKLICCLDFMLGSFLHRLQFWFIVYRRPADDAVTKYTPFHYLCWCCLKVVRWNRHCIVWQLVINILEEHAASIFRVDLTAWCHTLDESNLHSHHHENIRFHVVFWLWQHVLS
jgi:hypothetical protein